MQVGGQARGHGEVQLAEELVAVFAVELQGEGGVGAGGRVGGAGLETRVEGADLARALGAVGTRFEAEDLGRFLFGERRVPGEELGAWSCRRCTRSASPSGRDRRRRGAAGSLRRGPGAGLRSTPSAGRFRGSGLTEPTSLALIPKPEAIRKRRYWSPGFGSPM